MDQNQLLESSGNPRLLSDPMLDLYRRALIAYAQNRLPELLAIANEAQDFPQISDLMQIRLGIRTGQLDWNSIVRFTERIPTLDPGAPPGAGEAWFVCALAAGFHKKLEYARAWYERAAYELDRHGSPKKALKARLNALVAQSQLQPELRLIPEYSLIISSAKQLGDRASAGVALLNLSREYQRLGFMDLSLESCVQCIEILQSDAGSLHFGLAQAHHAHLLIELDRKAEAYPIYLRAQTSAFSEVQEALVVLDHLLSEPIHPRLKFLTPTWAERLKAPLRIAPRAELEQRLVALLTKGPKDKSELIIGLYGEKLSHMHAENRFKVLLSRLRKRAPGLVGLSEGRYRLLRETRIG